VPPLLLGLLVLSGLLHAVWNLLLKQSGDKMIATAWALAAGCLLWGRYAIIGGMMLSSYMLSLWVYARASLSYSGAVRRGELEGGRRSPPLRQLRKISVVFGAILGWMVLGEPLGRQRALGSLVIFSGILTIALTGR